MAKFTNMPVQAMVAGRLEPLVEAWLTASDQSAGVRLRKALVEQNIVASDGLCGDLCPHHGDYGNCQLSDPSAYGDHLAEVEEGEPDENGQRRARYVRSNRCIEAESRAATKRRKRTT